MSTPLIRLELPLGELGRLTAQPETIAPAANTGAVGSSGNLDVDQRPAVLGEPVPIVFCRLLDGAGGVLIGPPATDGRFESDSSGNVTARYQLLLSEGRIGAPQARDVFQQSCRVGTFTMAYGRRAGDWGPGRVVAALSSGGEPPALPVFVGTAGGNYQGLSMGSFTVTIPSPFDQWRRQVWVFVRNGMEVYRFIEGTVGSSDNFVDLVGWALQRTGRMPPQLISGASLLTAAQFLDANGLTFNGVIEESSNLLDWIARVAPHYLLRFIRSRGVYSLRPLLPTEAGGAISTSAVTWSVVLRNVDVDVASIRLTMIPRGDRMPVAVVAQWRQQPTDTEGIPRSAILRYGSSAEAGPYIQFDLSGYCTRELHAIRFCAYQLAARRYITHRLTVRVLPSREPSGLEVGDLIRADFEVTAPVTGTARIDQLYTVEQMNRSPGGVLTLELLHFPVDSQGRSVIALDVTRAQGTGVLLPSGRAPVSCDANDPDDPSVPTDPGPWPGWPGPDEYPIPTYPPDETPPPDVDPFEPTPPPDIPISPFNPDPPPQDPDSPTDDWGPGLNPVPAIDEIDPGIGPVETPPEGEDYIATLSVDQLALTYPENMTLITESNAVGVAGRLTVDNPPIDTDLTIVLSDGRTDRLWSLQIPAGETSTQLPSDFTTGSDVPTASVIRSVTVEQHNGGNYQAAEGDPVTINPTTFTLEVYVGTISVDAPGRWTYSGGWIWAGEDVPDWDWDDVTEQWAFTGTATGWTWDQANQRWTYSGTAPTDWEWVVAEQRWRRITTTSTDWRWASDGWVYTGATTPPPAAPADIEAKPADPPEAPLPAPTIIAAPDPASYAVTLRLRVDKVPIGIPGTDDLGVTLEDYYLSAGELPAGVLPFTAPNAIPAVLMQFGSWRWIPAAQWWQHTYSGSEWRWMPDTATWLYLLDPGDWTWSQNQAQWIGGTGAPPSAPPFENGTPWPPDAERWTWDALTAQWVAPVSEVTTPGGTPPDVSGLGLLSGIVHYEVPYSLS